ncbi:ATP-binding cassette domain-containing protein [Aeromicrobium sp. SORGH_AS_0981]|uniref:ATP-binding cassette domain-containing protein n=1 Tax=Aeromicrobium sp. SORGH_AS_0981 TaxID=3041802 RepID=UPI00286C82B1|nr:ATP-binding cassette domain-containing protein [Aeromicrobium sp. SORGH_AS_0981]
MAQGAVEVEGLSVWVGATPLVRDVSWQQAAGERVALLGRSGSGKSTIARAVADVSPPTLRVQGRVSVGGSQPDRPRASLVAQDSQVALNPLTPVRRQLARPLRSAGLRGDALDARLTTLLADVDLDAAAVLDRLPAELSGGQRQRVCIALAIAVDGPLLVADEPTSALDVVTRRQVVDALRATRSTLLLITHDLEVAQALCTRALLVDGGRLVADVDLRTLLDGPDRYLTHDLGLVA